jgi:hypothetical protein
MACAISKGSTVPTGGAGQRFVVELDSLIARELL